MEVRAGSGNEPRDARTLVFVRAITVVLGVICASMCAGCYASDGRRSDASPIDVGTGDAGVDDAGEIDAGRHDAAGLDAAVRLPSCDLPVRQWAETTTIYPGVYAPGAARLRFGQETWIAAATPGSRVEMLLFEDAPDPESGGPGLVDVVRLAGSALGVWAGARDALRIAIVGSDELRVFDPSGALLAAGPVDPTPDRVTLALRETRVGMTQDRPGVTTAFVLDASSGLTLSRTELEGFERAAVGLGRGLFQIVATPGEGESRLLGLDEGGVVDAAGLDAGLVAVSWDDSTALGLTREGDLMLRRPGSALERLAAGVSVVGDRETSVAIRGDAIVAVHYLVESLDEMVIVDAEGELPRRALPGGGLSAVMAHASRRHRGVFVGLASRRAIVWVGWSCDPDA